MNQLFITGFCILSVVTAFTLGIGIGETNPNASKFRKGVLATSVACLVVLALAMMTA